MTPDRLGRLALAFIGLAFVGACNVVMTEKPLFTQTDAAGAPALRPGVWSFFHEPGCKVDESRPFTEWPNCSGGGIVRDGEIIGANGGKDQPMPLIIAAGEPRIAQLQMQIDVTAGAAASASGGAQASASASVSAPKAAPYGYVALKPTKFDAEGRITAFRFWPVQCGPPPPNDKGGEMGSPTEHLLPGLERPPGETVCTTHSIDSLRNAARASEAWDDDHQQSHWVRDGEK